MKPTLGILFMAVLCGCGKPDSKVAELEKRIACLESNVAVLSETQSNSVEASQEALQKIQTLVSNDVAAIGGLLPVIRQQAANFENISSLVTNSLSSNTPLIDLNTGLPLASGDIANDNVNVLRVANRVTEANDVYWKWAITVYIANPGFLPEKVDVTVKFLDQDGFIIDTKDMYGLQLSAHSTNSFSGYQLISLPGAKNVASIRADLQ